IVYQELLTGQRPFDGTNSRQLLLQHTQSAPDLTSLPAADRPVVERALAKQPNERFPTCSEFVRALRTGRNPPPVRTPSAVAAGQPSSSPKGTGSRSIPRNRVEPINESAKTVLKRYQPLTLSGAGDAGQDDRPAVRSVTPSPQDTSQLHRK